MEPLYFFQNWDFICVYSLKIRSLLSKFVSNIVFWCLALRFFGIMETLVKYITL